MASPHEAPSAPLRTGTGLARPLRDAFHLPAQDTSVGQARSRVHEKLREWGVTEESCEDARLLVSEMFTNAVRHTDSEKVSCELWVIGVRLRLEVTDEGGSRVCTPQPRGADHDGEGGRGLLLVSVLSDEWGVRPEAEQGRGRGHAVWAELPCARTVC